MSHPDPETFLPLTAPEYHVLLAVGEDALHGYGMMRALEEKTGGADALLPGTLYTTLARMVDRGLLEELDRAADARRRRPPALLPRHPSGAGGGARRVRAPGPPAPGGAGIQPGAPDAVSGRGGAWLAGALRVALWTPPAGGAGALRGGDGGRGPGPLRRSPEPGSAAGVAFRGPVAWWTWYEPASPSVCAPAHEDLREEETG